MKSFWSRIRGDALGGVWALVWMWPLIGPLFNAVNGKIPHAHWTVAALAVFVVLYLSVVTTGFSGRHPRPTASDLIQLALFAAIGITLLWGYGSDSSWFNIMIYIAVSGVTLLPRSAALAWVIGNCLLFVAYGTIGPGTSSIAIASVLFGILLACTLVFTVKQMSSYIDLLRSTRKKLAATAVFEERLRFSRDLHDLLGHTLSLIVVKAEVIRRLVDQDPAAAALAAADIETIGRKALADVRQAVTGYRDQGFATELAGARAALTDAGIKVRVVEDGPPLPPRADGLFGWAVREASTNVIRHSRARTCTITVTAAGPITSLKIADDGIGGVRETTTGTGLLGLRERFGAVGGAVTTASPPGNGFTLIATLPAEILENALEGAS